MHTKPSGTIGRIVEGSKVESSHSESEQDQRGVTCRLAHVPGHAHVILHISADRQSRD